MGIVRAILVDVDHHLSIVDVAGVVEVGERLLLAKPRENCLESVCEGRAFVDEVVEGLCVVLAEHGVGVVG